MIDFGAARLTMVESQLRPNKVTDQAVLDAFLAVPRERFVPPALASTAYVDDDLPLGGGRFLMEPMVLARLIQLAQIGPDDAVLEIGAGTGYGTAIAARLAGRVAGVECDAKLAASATARLTELGLGNAAVIEGPLAQGYRARAPYQVVLFEGRVAQIPDAIAAQVAEGGRIVAVLGDAGGMGRAVLMTRNSGVLSRRPVFDAAVPALPGLERAPSFVF
jgi:protein-L-isoaspartate(D-aspartate) O-methyltransferase